jgi:hypothetical protein
LTLGLDLDFKGVRRSTFGGNKAVEEGFGQVGDIFLDFDLARALSYQAILP